VTPQLPTLSIELHLIFSFLDMLYIFRIGLTCQHFWSIAKSMVSTFLGLLRIWAGSPIICIGGKSSVSSDAYPPGLLISDDEGELRQGLDSDEVDDWSIEDYSGQPVGLYVLAQTRYDIPGEVCRSFPTVLLGLALGLIFKGPRPQGVLDAVRPRLSSFYPTGRLCILRNLATRELVTSQAIAPKPDDVRCPFINVLGFGEVILSRGCWSTYRSISMGLQGRDPPRRLGWTYSGYRAIRRS
jgi:hypothetical protein